jgi:RNA polymerase sigma-70 factor, ECF subfamily
MPATSLLHGKRLYHNAIPNPSCNGTVIDEAALIRKIVGGQQDLFGDLIAPHLTALSYIVRSTIGCYPDVEDIVQQTAFKAFTHLAQFRFEAGFKTWFIQIGLNEARQWRRKHASLRLLEVTPHCFAELPIADQRPSPLIEYQRSETSARLGAALAHLPEKYRIVILLRDIEGFSISEVAMKLDLTVPAVKTRLRRARQKIADDYPVAAACQMAGEHFRRKIPALEFLPPFVSDCSSHL